MIRKQLRVKIPVEYKHIGHDYKEHIHKNLINMYQNKCSHKYGYILDIENINNIYNNNLINSRNDCIIFNVVCTAKVLKPEVNQILKGDVFMIIEDGILLKIINKINVLVPSYFIQKYTYEDGKFIDEEHQKCISVGDKIDIKIYKIRYENNNFSCIGHLHEDLKA
jgi:DNA-directed RNA polymerase subunit E'/Rpb7